MRAGRCELGCHAAGFGKMVEMMAVMAKAHGVRTQLNDEVMKFGCWHESLDIVPAGPAGPLGIAKNLAPASSQQALGRGGENIRHARGDMFDWFEQHRVGLGKTLGNPQAGRGPERHIGAVDSMEHAINQRDCHIDHGITEGPLLHGLLGSLANCGDILLWHCPADDFIDEQKAFSTSARLNLELDVGELAVTARLALEPRVLKDGLPDRFLEGDLRLGGGNREVVIGGEALDCRIEMNLALPLEERFAGFEVMLNNE